MFVESLATKICQVLQWNDAAVRGNIKKGLPHSLLHNTTFSCYLCCSPTLMLCNLTSLWLDLWPVITT